MIRVFDLMGKRANPQNFHEHWEPFFTRWGTNLRNCIELLIAQEGPLGEGTYQNSIRTAVEIGGFSAQAVVFSDGLKYAIVIEEGRGIGKKMPPIDELIPWVEDNLGLVDDENEDEATNAAWAIAINIKNKGMWQPDGKRQFQRCLDKMTPLIEEDAWKEYLSYITELLSGP